MWKEFVLKNKLKTIKGVLKAWNKDVFDNRVHHVDTLRDEIENYMWKGNKGVSLHSKIAFRAIEIVDLWSFLRVIDSLVA